MCTRKLLPVDERGPLETTRRLLAQVWERAGLDGMLVPVWAAETRDLRPTFVTLPTWLDRADPYAPLMRANTAPQAARLLAQHPDSQFGLVLRPCELRSLRQLARRGGFNLAGSLTICPDCLATFPTEDFAWRVEQGEDLERLTRDSLHFAAQGGILPSRLRGSCQFCDHPYPQQADLHIQVLGLETHRHLVIDFRDEALASKLGMGGPGAQEVPAEVSERRQRVLDKLADWRQRSRAFAQSHLDVRLASLPRLLDHLQRCLPCREHLSEACPLFATVWETSRSGQDDEPVQDWLLSCGGCGMCEHFCPEGFPLFSVIDFLGRPVQAFAA